MLLEFPLTVSRYDTLSVVVSQIVGFASGKDGAVMLYTSGGHAFALSEDYATVKDRIATATAPKKF